MSAARAAETAIVEEQDVEVDVVQVAHLGQSITYGAVAGMEQQHCGVGESVGRNPPAVDLRLAGGVNTEVNFGEGETVRGRIGCNRTRWSQDVLPLGVIEG